MSTPENLKAKIEDQQRLHDSVFGALQEIQIFLGEEVKEFNHQRYETARNRIASSQQLYQPILEKLEAIKKSDTPTTDMIQLQHRFRKLQQRIMKQFSTVLEEIGKYNYAPLRDDTIEAVEDMSLEVIQYQENFRGGRGNMIT